MPNVSKTDPLSSLACILGGVLFPISIAIHPLRDGARCKPAPIPRYMFSIAVALMLVLFGLPEQAYLSQAEKIGSDRFHPGFQAAF